MFFVIIILESSIYQLIYVGTYTLYQSAYCLIFETLLTLWEDYYYSVFKMKSYYSGFQLSGEGSCIYVKQIHALFSVLIICQFKIIL